ncbi:type VI secretion system tip protein VgrG, partial [Salmonella enterica]|nr:type VI secretion system tip protein VgrG [Salmonella enterica]
MSSAGLRFTLKVDGIQEMSTAVVSFSLHQKYSIPFTLEVDIASGLFDLAAEDFLEKNAVLTVWQGDTPQRYVSGIVTSVQPGENNGWQMRYWLSINPPLWRAGLRQNFRIFQQQDIRTISATLLNEAGVTDWMPLFYEAHPAREFCVQYGETDLGFLMRLWAEEGLFFFERCGKEGPEQRLAVCDDVAGLTSAGTLGFNPDTTTGGTTAYISDFRYRAQISPSSVESQDYTFRTPGWPGYYSHDGDSLNGQRTRYEIYDYPGRFKDEQHGRDFTRYRLEGLRNDAEAGVCFCNTPKLWPGVRFTLTDHPSG